MQFTNLAVSENIKIPQLTEKTPPYQWYDSLINNELYIEITRFKDDSVFVGEWLNLAVQPDNRSYHAFQLGLLK